MLPDRLHCFYPLGPLCAAEGNEFTALGINNLLTVNLGFFCSDIISMQKSIIESLLDVRPDVVGQSFPELGRSNYQVVNQAMIRLSDVTLDFEEFFRIDI